MDRDADRNSAWTDGYASFAAGGARRPPSRLSADEQMYWKFGWDEAAVTAQRHRNDLRPVLEKRDELIDLLQEAASIARAYAGGTKTPLRDRDRCIQLIAVANEIGRQLQPEQTAA